jgi:hypothetical protein
MRDSLKSDMDPPTTAAQRMRVRWRRVGLHKPDRSPKSEAIGAAHDYPAVAGWRPRLTVRTVAGGDERDFDHGSAPRDTRTQTGVVGLPKCSITLEMNFALSFESQPQRRQQ